MSKILKEISSDSINYYIEQNLDDFYTKASQHPHFVSHIEEKINWVLARYADWPDCIFKANFEKLEIKKEIQNIKKLIHKKDAPNGWTIGPLTKPINLGKILEKNGFSNVYQQAGMAIDLETLNLNTPISSALSIEIVNDEESLKKWANNVSSVFHIKVDQELLTFLLTNKEVRFYIGIFEEKVVSTLLLYLSSGVAGLHAVTTLPEYRGKKFAYTISKVALADAFKMGYKIGVLQASRLGEFVYKRIGFKKYCKITSYELVQ